MIGIWNGYNRGRYWDVFVEIPTGEENGGIYWGEGHAEFGTFIRYRAFPVLNWQVVIL